MRKSPFSNWGSNNGKRNISNDSRKDGSKANTTSNWNNLAADNANDQAQDWGNNNWNSEPANENWQTNDVQQPAGDTWPSVGQGSQRKSSHGTNNTVQKNGNDHWATATTWGQDPEHHTGDSWNNNDNTNNDAAWCSGANGGGSNASKKSGSAGNNVMPGSWVETPTVPVWGDPTAAADTQGANIW